MSNEILVQPTHYLVYQRMGALRHPFYTLLWDEGDSWCLAKGSLANGATLYEFPSGEWSVSNSPLRSDEFIANTRRPLEVCLEKAKELVREASGASR